MKIVTTYVCGECGMLFQNKDDCMQHEENCGKENTFTCYKCGGITVWKEIDPQAFIVKNQCHTINLGKMGYGSNLDGCDVKFNLCDDCLVEVIKSLILKEKVHSSGDNYYD